MLTRSTVECSWKAAGRFRARNTGALVCSWKVSLPPRRLSSPTLRCERGTRDVVLHRVRGRTTRQPFVLTIRQPHQHIKHRNAGHIVLDVLLRREAAAHTNRRGLLCCSAAKLRRRAVSVSGRVRAGLAWTLLISESNCTCAQPASALCAAAFRPPRSHGAWW